MAETEQSAPAVDSAPSVTDRLASLFGESEQSEAANAADAPEEAADEPEQGEPTDDGEDFEIDGATYKLPPELKAKVSEWRDGALRQADYTRKTQELAELHKSAQLTAQAVAQRQQFEQGVATERAELARIEADLARYKAVDWASLEVGDYVKLRGQMDQLRERAGEVQTAIDGKAKQFQEWAAGQQKQIIEQGQRYLRQAIKDWGPEAQKQVIAGAKATGFTDAELESVFDARFVHLAWKAAQFDKLQAGKAAAVGQAQKAPPVVKPGASSNQSSAAIKDKILRDRVKKSGDLKSVAALLAHRMR